MRIERVGELDGGTGAGALGEQRRGEAGDPNRPGGSAAVPVRTTRLICTTGSSCCSTIQTGRPLLNRCLWMTGAQSGASSRLRALVATGACPVAAATETATRNTAVESVLFTRVSRA